MKGEDGEDEGEGTFNSKSVWRRFSVIAAGPIFNFILAFFGAMIIIGIIGYDPPVVTQVKEGTPEEAMISRLALRSMKHRKRRQV